ncbi:Rossmann-like and DUF2520 domain-containing protein [Nonlabens xiamenensis]|uniref:Rossmann-like and DUF2520 domain-containing protein n=1 Tax=Nonlabens xiamenensis TaxID=2341043 RepID=UPI000F6103CA|nr:Rossmann-like and DUF2520 domain-containing protein [Nonlabens xiamenensis]
MIKIVVIGTGNLGTHLCRAFDASGIPESSKADVSEVELVGYYNRSGRPLEFVSAPLIKNLDQLPDADLILLCVPDDQVPAVSSSLSHQNSIIAHTSGSVAMQALSDHENHGVFYIPQSFSKKRSVDFSQLALCLEASDSSTMKILERVASSLSRKRFHLDSLQRRQLHLAAVYVNNFVNHCYTKAETILQEAEIPSGLLQPLMEETLQKALNLGAKNAQTGPALRQDQSTILAHLALLPPSDHPMYKTITQSIQETHAQKL